jgi:hypothetical protein
MVYLVIPLLLSFHFTLFFHLLLCAEQSIHPKAVTAYVMLITVGDKRVAMLHTFGFVGLYLKK